MSASHAVMVPCDKEKDAREETSAINKPDSPMMKSTKKPTATTLLHTKSVLGRQAIKTSLKRGSNEAKFIKEDRTYQLRPNLIANNPFSAVIYTIPNGPYKGRQALVLDPSPQKKHRLNFMELPGEIRNRIYGYALLEADFETANHEIRIYRQKKTFQANKRGLPATTALFRVSKQVNREAVTILYGFGAFWFSTTTVFTRFLLAIGKANSSYLTNVTIGFDVTSSTKRAAELLQHATLRRLKLDFHDWTEPFRRRGEPSMPEFVRNFLPVLKVIHRTRGSTPFFDIMKMAKPARLECPSSQYLDYKEPEWWWDDQKLACKHPGCEKLRITMTAFKGALRKRKVPFDE